MILSKRKVSLSKFQLTVNNSFIERSDCIRYLGVMIDEKLTWKNHVDKLYKKLSKICGLIFKLRHYVPLATCKLVQSVILYSLINWGRTNVTNRRNLKVLQNKFVRASLFSPRNTSTNLLYNQFQSLKLRDMIDMEFAKFVFKFKHNLLPSSFKNYFVKLDCIYKYNTRQQSVVGYYHHSISSEFGRKRLQYTLA